MATLTLFKTHQCWGGDGLGRRSTVVAIGHHWSFKQWSNWCSEENKIYSFGGDVPPCLCARRAFGQNCIDLLNSAEIGCSEENWSFSGGYPELIYSAKGINLLAWAHGRRSVTCPKILLFHKCKGKI